MNNSSVCVDASVLLKMVVDEDLSDRVSQLRDHWAGSGIQRVAPSLIDYEIVSALNQKQRRGLLTAEATSEALEVAFLEPLLSIDTNDLHRAAQRMATRLRIPSTYDAHYLAVAEELDCEFWTADERLYNAVRDRFPLIRWVGAA